MNTTEKNQTPAPAILQGVQARIEALAPPGEARGELNARLERLVRLTLQANERMNLTADSEPSLFWTRHIEDSLWAAQRIEERLGRPEAGARVLDVGSGGGIPGLIWPLVWPRIELELMEARQKRCEFLSQTLVKLDARGKVHAVRAEEAGHAPELRGQFELVTARALASLATLAELTLPFVRSGGWVAAIKTADFQPELTAAAGALQTLGSDPAAVRLEPYTRSDGKLCVVCLIPKLRETPEPYPRRAGMPSKRPLH